MKTYNEMLDQIAQMLKDTQAMPFDDEELEQFITYMTSNISGYRRTGVITDIEASILSGMLALV
jgi:CHASE3 domain sensor protein